MSTMNAKEQKRLQAEIEELATRIPRKASNALQPDFVIRVLKRLSEFSGECETCREELQGLVGQIDELAKGSDPLSLGELRPLQKRMDRAVSHLQNRHKLLVQGQSQYIYIAVGLSLGLVFGLALFDNAGLGLAIGVALGAAIGSGQDAKAKKDDRLI